MSLKNIKVIYVQCSPGLGALDNWLPILESLKRSYQDLQIICVVPKTSILANINLFDSITLLANEVFDAILFRTNRSLWGRVDSFEDAKYYCVKPAYFNAIYSLLFKISSRLRCVNIFEKLWFYLNRRLYKSVPGEKKELRFDEEALYFYDVIEESKDYTLEILSLASRLQKFSICHGINIYVDNNLNKSSYVKKRGEVTSLLFSELEVSYYRNFFNQHDDDLRVIGIPRHDNGWIDIVKQKCARDYTFKDFVFIISRPADVYLPLDRKATAIQNLKEIIIDEKGIPLLVRLHPKERHEGIYEKILGKKNKGVTWDYSLTHPLVIGSDCQFAVSFYSGVSVDLAYLKKNTIEYLDLSGLPKYDNNLSLRDKLGRPVLSYRYLGIVHGVNSFAELRDKVDAILLDANREYRKIGDCYKTIFFQENPLSTALVEIERSMKIDTSTGFDRS